jgi:hypothetical protein
MARTLSVHCAVRVALPSSRDNPEGNEELPFQIVTMDMLDLGEILQWADIVIAQSADAEMLAYCNTHKKILIMDLYAPVPVESMIQTVFAGRSLTDADDFVHRSIVRDYRNYLSNADAFLYSNRRQLDFWLGYIFGAGLTSPQQYRSRDVLSQFIEAPMGIDAHVALPAGDARYKGVVPGISQSDTLFVWNGGIYDWYDGVTLMQAMRIVQDSNTRIKLLFPGIRHPESKTPEWHETTATVQEARRLGLEGVSVFFFEQWVDYDLRLSYLSEADAAIYTHKSSVEMELSHRTRVLDHFLASLPTIATEGDYFAELVTRHGLGRTVPAYDVQTLAEAILSLSDETNLKKAAHNMDQIRSQFDWDVTLAPLIDYIGSNPTKVPSFAPAKAPSKRSRYLKGIRRSLPYPVKQAIIRNMPTRMRNRLSK